MAEQFPFILFVLASGRRSHAPLTDTPLYPRWIRIRRRFPSFSWSHLAHYSILFLFSPIRFYCLCSVSVLFRWYHFSHVCLTAPKSTSCSWEHKSRFWWAFLWLFYFCFILQSFVHISYTHVLFSYRVTTYFKKGLRFQTTWFREIYVCTYIICVK